MIRRRAVLDTVNPPGQARYLRDVIMRIQDEDRTKAESAEVYVVYEHDYDNSGIRGIFTTKAKADAYVAEQQKTQAGLRAYQRADLEVQIWGLDKLK